MTTDAKLADVIAELRELMAKATDGPWRLDGFDIKSNAHDGRHVVASSDPQWGLNRNGDNARLVVALHTHADLLLTAASRAASAPDWSINAGDRLNQLALEFAAAAKFAHGNDAVFESLKKQIKDAALSAFCDLALPYKRRAEIAEEALAAKASAPGGQGWRHKKRGTTYFKLGVAQVQAPRDDPLTDYECVEVYRGEDGQLWVRRCSEFRENFELLAAAPEPAPAPAASRAASAPEPKWGNSRKPMPRPWRIYNDEDVWILDANGDRIVVDVFDVQTAELIVDSVNNAASDPGGQGWQPIETAPWRGPPVLLYRDGEMFTAARLQGEHGPGWCTPDGFAIFRPTHWMPLPAPPGAAAPEPAPAPAASRAASAPGGQEGWQWVPKKLTDAMLDAGCECNAYEIAVYQNKNRHEDLMAKYPEIKPLETHGAAPVQTLPIIWAAMLAAAPELAQKHTDRSIPCPTCGFHVGQAKQYKPIAIEDDEAVERDHLRAELQAARHADDAQYERAEEFRAELESLKGERDMWKQSAGIEASLRREFIQKSDQLGAELERYRKALEASLWLLKRAQLYTELSCSDTIKQIESVLAQKGPAPAGDLTEKQWREFAVLRASHPKVTHE